MSYPPTAAVMPSQTAYPMTTFPNIDLSQMAANMQRVAQKVEITAHTTFLHFRHTFCTSDERVSVLLIEKRKQRQNMKKNMFVCLSSEQNAAENERLRNAQLQLIQTNNSQNAEITHLKGIIGAQNDEITHLRKENTHLKQEQNRNHMLIRDLNTTVKHLKIDNHQ